jgi:HSP20 family protein
MTLVRWDPARELSSLQHEVNRLFGSFFDLPAFENGAAGARRRWIPAIDLAETADEYVLRADLPGMSTEDVKIELEDNVLTLSGERKSEHEEKTDSYHRIERASGSFSRSLTLPHGIDPAAITARFADGVLEVRIPRPEQRKPHLVTIETADQPATIEGAEAKADEIPAAA